MDYRGDLIIVPESHDAANEPELYGEGEFTSSPDVYTFEGTDIDLTEVIRELLILEAPVHPRCEHAQQSCVKQEKEELPESDSGGKLGSRRADQETHTCLLLQRSGRNS